MSNSIKDKSGNQGFVFKSYGQGKTKNVCVKFTIVRSKPTIGRIGFFCILPVIFSFGFLFLCDNSSKSYLNSIFQYRTTAILIIIYILILSTIMLQFIFTIKKESLLIIVPIGIQFSSTYFYGKKTVTFIPWCAIEDIIIIEVISGQQVLFYLSVLLNDHYRDENVNGVLLLFQKTSPRLVILEEMYKTIQKILSSYVNLR